MRINRSRVVQLFIVMTIIAVTVCSISNPEKAQAKTYTIGFSAVASAIAPWAKAMDKNVQSECKKRGWDIIALSAEGDMQKQSEQVNTLITKKVDLIILFAGDNKISVDWVKNIHKAGIPCVLIAMNTEEKGRQYVNAFVGPDQEQMTRKMAEYIVKKHGADANLTIVSISGVPVQFDYIVRLKGFKEGIANTKYKFVGPEYAYSSRAEAQKFMETYISIYGKKINILMGFDDDLTLGGIAAIDEAGLKGIEVYSITGQNEALKAVKDGKMEMTVMNRTDLMAKKATEIAAQVLAGKKVTYNQPTELIYITKDNVDKYLGKGEF